MSAETMPTAARDVYAPLTAQGVARDLERARAERKAARERFEGELRDALSTLPGSVLEELHDATFQCVVAGYSVTRDRRDALDHLADLLLPYLGDESRDRRGLPRGEGDDEDSAAEVGGEGEGA